MTRKETGAILSVMKAAYPAFYRGFTDKDLTDIVNLWAEMFAEDDYKAVALAVKALITSSSATYPPAIGTVKEKLISLQSLNATDDTTAWAMVHKACQNGIYGYREEFAKLPPDVQAAVGAPEQLRTWGMMDEETLSSVIASNFMRNYRAQAKRTHDEALLPPEVRKLLPDLKRPSALPPAVTFTPKPRKET